MQGAILFLCVALAAGQGINYQPSLNTKKTYEYRYAGLATTGWDMPHLSESSVRIRCTFKISGISDQTYLLQISDLAFDEFNGVRRKSTFSTSTKMTQRLAAELASPVTFEFFKGRLGHIHTAPDVSDSTVNIVRGILEFLQITIKTTQVVYEVDELGIHGLCRNTYTIEEALNSTDLHVTQTVDINHCRQRAGFYLGMAHAREDKHSKKRGDNVIATVTCRYMIRPTEDGGLITDMHAKEYQLYSPFNVKGGNSKLQATKDITLTGVTESVRSINTGPVRNRGTIMYAHIQPQINNTYNPVAKVSELIDRLAKGTLQKVDRDTSADVLELYRLLRQSVTTNNLEDLWTKYSGTSEERRWLLDVIPEITDTRGISFLKDRLRTGDITANEATQMILLALNHLSANSETVEMSKEILTMPFTKSSDMLWKTAVLSYGSLVYRYCGTIAQCPVAAVQPLVDLATSSLSEGNENQMVLALKALGNAGHPSSIKVIMKFLPGTSGRVEFLPTRVQAAAVQSLRHMAVREPHHVQRITLDVFMRRTVSSEIRMMAFQILFETEPPLGLVSTITAFLMEESDLQVASFSYSLLKGLAKSQTPDNHFLSTACNVAVKLLAPKLGRLSFRYSKTLHFDWFNDDLLFGASADVYLLKNVNNFIPNTFISRMKTYFIGRILETAELGVQSEGVQQLLSHIHSICQKKPNVSYAEAVLKVLSGLQSLPKGTPLLSAYARLLGQEVFFVDVNSDMIQRLMQALSSTAGQESPVWRLVDTIKKGLTWHWTKPYLTLETQYIQATILGLPAEISKYYLSVTGITANAKADFSPAPTDKLGQLLNANINLESDGHASYTKDIHAFHGIKTDIVQSGVEFISQVTTYFPWNLSMKKKGNKYLLNSPPLKNETDVFSINHNIYVVSRNIEEPALAKMTPMMAESENMSQNLQPDQQVTGEPSQGQTSLSEVFHFHAKECIQANLYGLSVCIESDERRPHYLGEYPLNYFLGKKECTVKLEPVKTDNTIEKLQLEISTETTREIQEVTESAKVILTQKLSKLSEAAEYPALTAAALAVSGSAENEGYEVIAYFSQTSQKDELQFILSQLGKDANWRACVDTNVDGTRRKTKMQLQWGAECQTYKMTAEAETTHTAGFSPTLHTRVMWEEVPEHLQEIAKRVKEYIPGMALLLNLDEKQERNVDNQICASVTSSTPESITVQIKTPELAVIGRNIPFPLQIPFEEIMKSFSTSPSELLQGKNALCTISGNSFRTFDNTRFTSPVAKGCYFVLVKDCSTDDFQVLMKMDTKEEKEIFIITSFGSVNLNYVASAITLKVNDSSIALSSLPQTDPSGTILIDKSENGIVVQAPTLGLSRVYFDGETMEVEVESGMKRKVCGLCGKTDEENQSGFKDESLLIGRHPMNFLTSWMQPRPSGRETCELRPERVQLEQVINELGTLWTCNSVEPVLRCREGCSSTDTRRYTYNFICAPPGANESEPLTPPYSYGTQSVTLALTADTHLSCLCSSDLSLGG